MDRYSDLDYLVVLSQNMRCQVQYRKIYNTKDVKLVQLCRFEFALSLLIADYAHENAQRYNINSARIMKVHKFWKTCECKINC